MRPQHGSVLNRLQRPQPTSHVVWVICLECQTSTSVVTRQEFARFDESHRKLCGRTADVTPMFGDFDELLDLPAC
jgi:hypothetical protein